MMMPIEQGFIQVNFTYEQEDDNGDIDTLYKEMKLKLTAPMVNNYVNNLTPEAQTALNNSDMINGDEQIYVKGDAGSEAVIQLFNNQQLHQLRTSDWMINQAELYLYVDKDASEEMLTETKRLFLYDYDNQKPLVDIYAYENTDNDFNAYDGYLQEDDNGEKYYKFGITRHIRNIIKKDSTNVKLGLRVTDFIKTTLKEKDLFKDPDAYNPSGIILFGNQTVSGKKPMLKIYYTDPE
jgi:hypothetical protein